MASLYQILGNDGVRRKLKLVRSIQSLTGQSLYEDTKPDKEGEDDQVLNTVDDQPECR